MDVEITELTAIDPESVHFVRKPANGFSPLLAKAVDEVEEVVEGEVEEVVEGEVEGVVAVVARPCCYLGVIIYPRYYIVSGG